MLGGGNCDFDRNIREGDHRISHSGETGDPWYLWVYDLRSISEQWDILDSDGYAVSRDDDIGAHVNVDC